MPLSAQEQKAFDELTSQLGSLKVGKEEQRARLGAELLFIISPVVAVLGVVFLAAPIAKMVFLTLGVIGICAALACLFLFNGRKVPSVLFAKLRKNPTPVNGNRAPKVKTPRALSNQSFMEKMESRWQRRQDEKFDQR